MQGKNKGLNKQIVSLLICTVMAFALWVYVSYVEDPSLSRWQSGIPVTISGEDILNDNGLALASVSTEKVDVKFSAPRSRFKYLSTDSVKATLDVSSITQKGDCELDVVITCSSDFTIVDQRKTSVKLSVEEYIPNKFFTIEPNITKKPSDGYFVKTMHIDNKDMQVSVSGAITQVEKVVRVKTSAIDLSSVADDTTITAKIIPVDKNGKEVKNVSLNMDSANISFVINKTVALPLEVVFVSGGDSPKLNCIPEIDEISVTGPAKAIDQITSIQTQPISEYNHRAGSEVNVSLVLPQNVTLFDRETNKIKLKFEKVK